MYQFFVPIDEPLMIKDDNILFWTDASRLYFNQEKERLEVDRIKFRGFRGACWRAKKTDLFFTTKRILQLWIKQNS